MTVIVRKKARVTHYCIRCRGEILKGSFYYVAPYDVCASCKEPHLEEQAYINKRIAEIKSSASVWGPNHLVSATNLAREEIINGVLTNSKDNKLSSATD